MTTTRRENHNPSLWAFILIALGAVWLLAEANIISGANLVVLFRLWPILLIGFGLELLFGRGSRSLSLLIGLGTVALLVALMIVGPALGWAPTVETRAAQFDEPLGNATSAQINLDLSVGRTTIQALTDSTALIDADLRYIGDVNFSVNDGVGGEKFVSLSSKNDSVQAFDFLGLLRTPEQDAQSLHWDIGLSPSIPLDVRLNGGVGDNNIDLSGLTLSNLNYNTGVGNTTISLPGAGSYGVDLNGGVGSLLVSFADGAAVSAAVNAGVGGITLDVPDDAAVRLEVQGGLGEAHVPANFTRISGEDSTLNHEGVWESAGYQSASNDARITIRFNGGVGELTVR